MADKLDELGGTARAMALSDTMGGEELEIVLALIERVERQESNLGAAPRLLQECDKRILKQMAQLQAARELAESVIRHGEQWGWFHGIVDKHWRGRAMELKAREFLKKLEGK